MSSEKPSLKLILVDPADQQVLFKIEKQIPKTLQDSEVVAVFGNACVVYTALDTSELRDAVGSRLPEGASCLIVEFETWSGYGPEIDSEWLMRRGH